MDNNKHIKESNFLYLIGLLLIILGGFYGCSNKKNTFISRNYHQMTTHYNYYFNAREIMRQQEEKLQDNYKDNYDEILPLFVFGTEEDSKSMKPDMENVIEKCSKAIKLHSIKKRDKEHNKWIDDCYFLIAKAEFYNKEYETSLKTFNYIARAYKDQETRWDAMLWIIRIDHLLEKKDKLSTMMKYIESKTKFPNDLSWKFNAIKAQLKIDKGQYEDAIRLLNTAISKTKDRKQRARFTFVLAQLYQLKRNYRKATDSYTQVIRYRPDYVMEFQARINRVKAFDISRGDTKKIRDKMLKMLKDRKNEEYRDQICIALAELAHREGQDSMRIHYLVEATKVSMQGSKYLLQAYHKLAKIYFQQPNYVLAAQYYNSTMQAMSDDNPDYFKVKRKAESLKKLVTNINTVETQDSLQRIAAMDKKERDKYIKKLIKKAKEEAKRKQEEENDRIINNYGENSKDRDNNQPGNWYFYNPALIGSGMSDFKKKWGTRKLEDNWRRTDKSSASMAEHQEQEQEQDSLAIQAENEKFSEEYYLKDLPLTDSSITASNDMIMEALYNEGRIYKESFDDNARSIKAFKELLNRYDTCQYSLGSYYLLYRIYYTKNDLNEAEIYKQKIISGYPYSKYAKLVENPDYLKETENDKKRVENYYDIIYALYNKEKYDTVILRCNKSIELFPENHISQKFALLKALAIGQSESVDSFKIALKAIINDYPKTPEQAFAQKILDKIKSEKGDSLQSLNEVNYDTTDIENKEHRFILIAPLKDASINNIERSFSDFNKSSFPRDKLKIKSILLNKKINLVMVQAFKSKKKAMSYYKAVEFNKKQLKKVKEKEYKYFVISEKNFKTFYKDKKVDNYLSFFKMNYLETKQSQ